MKRIFLCGLLFCFSLVEASDQGEQVFDENSAPLPLKVVGKYEEYEEHMFVANDSDGVSYLIFCNPEDLSLKYAEERTNFRSWQTITREQINWGEEKEPTTDYRYNINPKKPEASDDEQCSAPSSTDVPALVNVRKPKMVGNRRPSMLNSCECKPDNLNESNNSRQAQFFNSSRGSQSEQGLCQEEQVPQALATQQELVRKIGRQHSNTANNIINQLSPKSPKSTGVKPFKPGPFWTWQKVVTVGVVVGGCVAGAAYYFYPRKTTDKAAPIK